MQLACYIPLMSALMSCGGDPSVNPDLQAANPPPEQIEFCQIIDDASDQYLPLAEQRRKEPNGTVQDRLTAQMKGVFDDRKQKISGSVQQRHMHVEEWGMKIDKISHYSQDSAGSGTVLELNLNANCRTRTTFQVDLADDGALAASLANFKAGDPLVITGNFVMHYTDTTPPVRALEWSVTPNRAMTTPEFHIEVTRFGVQAPSS